MTGKGGTYISLGFGEGPLRVTQALDQAFNHPLVGDISLGNSVGVVVKFKGKLSIEELNQGVAYVRSRLSAETELIPVVSEETLPDGRVEAFVLAAGIGAVPVHADYPSQNNTHYDEELPEIQSEPVGQFEYARAENEMQYLEIPAFIRKGYNVANSF